MSHLHIGDGILPWWLLAAGLAGTLALVAAALFRLGRNRRQLPRVAVMAAVGLAAMSIPLGLPVHPNLAALAGIILGPLNGFLSAFVVNLFHALLGHGGVTVLGVNSLLVGSEALLAGALFRLLGGAKRLLPNVALAVTVALLVSTLLALGAVGAAGGELEAMVHNHEHDEPQGDHPEAGFLKTFTLLIAPLVAVWLGVELAVSLLAVGYVNKIRDDWFRRE